MINETTKISNINTINDLPINNIELFTSSFETVFSEGVDSLKYYFIDDNTTDDGSLFIQLEYKNQRVLLAVSDIKNGNDYTLFGLSIGIEAENGWMNDIDNQPAKFIMLETQVTDEKDIKQLRFGSSGFTSNAVTNEDIKNRITSDLTILKNYLDTH